MSQVDSATRSAALPPAEVGDSLQALPAAVRQSTQTCQTVHLRACALALVLLGVVLASGLTYARWLEGRYVHALAPTEFEIKRQGSALQVESFRQPDLLPIYGSSELDSFVGPYHSQELFKEYPTGFETALFGRRGTTALVILQSLAAIGPDLRGKKVVICMSPTFFLNVVSVRRQYYTGNYSRLHGSELAFSTDLSLDFKQRVAHQMMRYPETMEKDRLSRFALEALDDESSIGPWLYYASLPLGKLQNAVWDLQDHWSTVQYIWSEPDLSSEVVRRERALDWPSLLASAEREAETRGSNNVFGFDNEYWLEHSAELLQQKGRGDDGVFKRQLRDGFWDEMGLLLEGLRQLGAQPLLLSVPMKGPFFDYWGITASARIDYYRRIRALTRPFGTALLDFEQFDSDKYFVADERSHPSQRGWAFYSQAIDDFYHDRTPR